MKKTLCFALLLTTGLGLAACDKNDGNTASQSASQPAPATEAQQPAQPAPEATPAPEVTPTVPDTQPETATDTGTPAPTEEGAAANSETPSTEPPQHQHTDGTN